MLFSQGWIGWIRWCGASLRETPRQRRSIWSGSSANRLRVTPFVLWVMELHGLYRYITEHLTINKVTCALKYFINCFIKWLVSRVWSVTSVPLWRAGSPSFSRNSKLGLNFSISSFPFYPIIHYYLRIKVCSYTSLDCHHHPTCDTFASSLKITNKVLWMIRGSCCTGKCLITA